MTGISAASSRRAYAVTGLVFAIGLGMAGCGSIDETLFGPNSEAPAQNEAPATPSDQSAPASSMPGTLPMSGPSAGGAGAAVSGSLTPVTIEPIAATGTGVSQTIQGLHDDLASLQEKIVQAAQQLGDLRNAAAQSAAAYHESKAQITTHLEMGTTRGNPELVAQWNSAQGSLDALTTNINSLNAVGSEIANAASHAHFVQDTIQATFNVSGAVDEDHRQLSVLQDEAGQTIVLIDRLLTEASADIQRQTAYVANERANLTTLASAIKNGEFYGTELGTPMMASVGGPVSFAAPSGAPLVTIKFDHANVAYQQILYTALAQALQSRPTSSFAIVAVSPTRGSAPAVQLAQTESQRHAQEVMRSMTDMGVPAARLSISSATDPGAGSSEVRVYVR